MMTDIKLEGIFIQLTGKIFTPNTEEGELFKDHTPMCASVPTWRTVKGKVRRLRRRAVVEMLSSASGSDGRILQFSL